MVSLYSSAEEWRRRVCSRAAEKKFITSTGIPRGLVSELPCCTLLKLSPQSLAFVPSTLPRNTKPVASVYYFKRLFELSRRLQDKMSPHKDGCLPGNRLPLVRYGFKSAWLPTSLWVTDSQKFFFFCSFFLKEYSLEF